AIGRLAHAHVAHDVLDLDDGVIHQYAGDDGDGQQTDEVQREAGRVDGPEGGDDRQRQGDGGNQRRAPVAQEQEHYDDGEDGALDQGLHGRVVGTQRVFDHRVDELELDVGVGQLELLDLSGNITGNHHVAGTLGARDGEGDHGTAVECGEGALLGRGVSDRSEFVQAHLAAARQDDAGGGKVGDGLLAGERANGLLAPGDLAAAAGQIDVGGSQLLVDVAGGDAEREQPVGIERDADLAVDAADALDLRYAFHSLQGAHHHIVDEPGELLRRHARRPGAVGDDRQALDLDAGDDRLIDGARQLGADAGNPSLHV